MSIVIIGGGVIGLNTAWSLLRKGYDVKVIEAKAVGESASGVNAGWVTPSLSTPLASPGILTEGLKQAFNPEGALVIKPQMDLNWLKWLWNFNKSAKPAVYKKGIKSLMHLNENTMQSFAQLKDEGVDFEYHQTGILSLAMKEGGLQWFTQLFDQLMPLGFKGDIEYLTVDEAREMEPTINKSVKEVAYTSMDGYVNPDTLLAGLREKLIESGVEIHEHTSVEEIIPTAGKWTINTSKGPFEADKVVIALGAATNQVLSSLKMKIPIIGGKGYSVVVQTEGVTNPSHALYLMESKLGLSPSNNGVRIAGVFEIPGKDDHVVEKRIHQLVEQTLPYMDEWEADNLTVSVGRAGLRPATPDSLPFIGPVPGFEGLYIGAGHGMLGVTLAPATADLLTTMISENKIPGMAEPFQLKGRM